MKSSYLFFLLEFQSLLTTYCLLWLLWILNLISQDFFFCGIKLLCSKDYTLLWYIIIGLICMDRFNYFSAQMLVNLCFSFGSSVVGSKLEGPQSILLYYQNLVIFLLALKLKDYFQNFHCSVVNGLKSAVFSLLSYSFFFFTFFYSRLSVQIMACSCLR